MASAGSLRWVRSVKRRNRSSDPAWTDEAYAYRSFAFWRPASSMKSTYRLGLYVIMMAGGCSKPSTSSPAS